MNAHEFVKQHGLDGAKYFLDLPCYSINQLAMLESGLSCDDLKRIVESHELVVSLGGVEKCEGYVQVCFYKGRDTYGNRLKQAIADVEACQ